MAITLDIIEIKKILPHRFPMLLVDRILDLEPMKWAVGVKNVSVNELQFQGHFPDEPIMLCLDNVICRSANMPVALNPIP